MFEVGNKGALIDGPFDADELDGASFVGRFSVGDEEAYGDAEIAVTPITSDEADAIREAGHTLVAISLVPTERIESGGDAGEEDGAADLKLWKSAGLERGSVIYVTYAGTDADAVKEYLDAYREALDEYYGLGLRSSTPVLKAHSDDIAALWRAGDLGANNDGGLDSTGQTLTGPQMRAMAANLLHTSPAQLCDFAVPDYHDVKLVYVLRGDEPAAAPETADEADGAPEDGTSDGGDGGDDGGDGSGNGLTDPEGVLAEYDHLTVAGLKEEIERRNSNRDEDRHISVTGKKSVLIEALRADDLAEADAKAAAVGAGDDPGAN